jgi:hypothetical protein
MAIEGMSKRLTMANTASAIDKEELVKRSNSCSMCAQALFKAQPAIVEEAELHQKLRVTVEWPENS